MKTLIYLMSLLSAILFTNSTFGEESDSSKVVKKIIKTIEINDNGKTLIDTIIYDCNGMDVLIDNDLKHFHEHMIEMGKYPMKKMWLNNNNEKEYEITFNDQGDSSKIIVINSTTNAKEHMFDCKNYTHASNFHKRNISKNNNLIDLNDPEIVSFERETTKNGNEKITIIRKK